MASTTPTRLASQAAASSLGHSPLLFSSSSSSSSFASSSKLTLSLLPLCQQRQPHQLQRQQRRQMSSTSHRQSAWPVGAQAEEDTSSGRSASASSSSWSSRSSTSMRGSSSSSSSSSTDDDIPRFSSWSGGSSAAFGASQQQRRAQQGSEPRSPRPHPLSGMQSVREEGDHQPGGQVAGGGAPGKLPPAPPRQMTIRQLWQMKEQGMPITCLTAYDYPSALSMRSAEVDICLVGDSLGNVALGYDSTQRLSLSAMLHHLQAVHRGLCSPLLNAPGSPPSPLLVVDLPFGAFAVSIEEGVRAVVKLVSEGGAHAVKIEGGQEVVPIIRRLTSFGIPVMAHIGLQPQRVAASSGYRLQGRTALEATSILEDALALQDAGAFAMVLECVPNKVGGVVARRTRIPIVGIGAGPDTDGQVLVSQDVLGDLTSPEHVLAGLAQGGGVQEGMTSSSLPLPSSDSPPPPKFVRPFAPLVASGASFGSIRMAAIQAYVRAVRERSFPDKEREGYKMKREEWEEFRRSVEEEAAGGGRASGDVE